MRMKLWVVGWAAMALVLAGCAGEVEQATPTAVPLSAAVAATVASSPATLPTIAPTPTPRPAGEVSLTGLAVDEEPAVRSGRLASAVEARLQPEDGAAVAGVLPASARVIVTSGRDGWLEIIYPDAPGGHAYVPQAAVDFAPVPPEPAMQPAAASETPAPPPAAAVASPQPASQPAPVRSDLSGALVFQTRNGGDIYIMQADGSGLRRLTYGFEPALSPDGTQVAFTRWDEPRGLWLVNVDGAGERLLVGANRPRSPTWTPDGQAIIFEQGDRSATCRLSPFGCLTDEQLIALFGGQTCLTTPFGVICVDDFELTTQNYTGLRRFDLASGEVRDLPASETAAAPQQRPDGAAVLFLDRNGLALTQTEGAEAPQRLVQFPPILGPGSYSPDGQFIYAARQAGGHWDIWRWRADGSEPVALTMKDPLAAQGANNVAPAASPDGQHVAFLTNRAGPWQLWVMNRDGSNPRPLAPQALAGVEFSFDFNSDRTVDWGP